MINRYKAILILALVPVAGFSNLAPADEIDVTEFVAGTIISSSDVNENFSTLAKESNENDARIASLESSASETNSSSSAVTYTFAGYTTALFNSENYGGTINLYTTSLHCKQEYGDSASILTSRVLEYLIFSGNSFSPPSESDALILFNSGEVVVTHRGQSSTTITERYDAFWDVYRGNGVLSVTPTGRLVTSVEYPVQVACMLRQ